jgi:Mn-dependent DtxR family transcriptional regulator
MVERRRLLEIFLARVEQIDPASFRHEIEASAAVGRYRCA